MRFELVPGLWYLAVGNQGDESKLLVGLDDDGAEREGRSRDGELQQTHGVVVALEADEHHAAVVAVQQKVGDGQRGVERADLGDLVGQQLGADVVATRQQGRLQQERMQRRQVVGGRLQHSDGLLQRTDAADRSLVANHDLGVGLEDVDD